MSTAEIEQADPSEDVPFGRFEPTRAQAAVIRFAHKSPLQRGWLREFTTRIIRKIRPGPLDVRFRGAAFRLHDTRNSVEWALLLRPKYNSEDLDFLLEGARPDACFVDLGSNVGLYAQTLALAAPQGRTLAIDANPVMIRRLRWNAVATGLTNLTVFHAGISDLDGTANLVMRKGDLGIVSLKESAAGSVPVRTLLSVVNEAGLESIHGLKIDIEGHEDKALVPFLTKAPRSLLPKRIVIERLLGDDDYPGCVASFDRLGYRLQGRSRNNSRYLLEA